MRLEISLFARSLLLESIAECDIDMIDGAKHHSPIDL